MSHYKRISIPKRIEIETKMETRTESKQSVGQIAREYGISKKHCYELGRKHHRNPSMEELERPGRRKK